MQCTVLIPHLWWPRDAGDEAYRELAVRELAMLLARGSRQSFPPVGWEAWLCQAFEVERQRDWPVAPLTLMVDGGDPGEAYWLRADPVHLRLHREQLVLADSNAFAVSRDEAAALTDAMNAYFAAERLHFSAPRPDRWYLRLDSDPQIVTCPLDEAAGGSIERRLPAGEKALEWHRIGNEIQMLLHAHPVNEAREARGELTVNGVWLWGGGRRAAVFGRHFHSVAADEPLAAALAANADIPVAPPGDDGTQWLARAQAISRATDHHLIVLAQLAGAVRRGDIAAWRDGLEALNRRWIVPLLAGLKAGAIGELAIVAPERTGCARFELHRAGLLKFWRRARPLSAYAPRAGSHP